MIEVVVRYLPKLTFYTLIKKKAENLQQ